MWQRGGSDMGAGSVCGRCGGGCGDADGDEEERCCSGGEYGRVVGEVAVVIGDGVGVGVGEVVGVGIDATKWVLVTAAAKAEEDQYNFMNESCRVNACSTRNVA